MRKYFPPACDDVRSSLKEIMAWQFEAMVNVVAMLRSLARGVGSSLKKKKKKETLNEDLIG